MIGVLNGLFDVAIRFHFWLAFTIFQLFVYLALFKFSAHFPVLCSVIEKFVYWTVSCIEFDIRQYLIRSSNIYHSEMFTQYEYTTILFFGKGPNIS